ncbi:heterokaryon incompatibility protein-domain-containing protein [Hypoxylon sp. FL1857]|nr:heterokaryon incompatibility protein-domain-containing protein [Hypoxylon sp. FL1857]
MRLLNAKTYNIHEFPNDNETPPYAILSHTWGDEECTFQHWVSAPDVSLRKGYLKIKLCCEQALKDGLEWAWVDTCCIDKTNNAELSEAINSMFRWYMKAAICYAYLGDVRDASKLGESRWFTRGWTLQELIAPKDVYFYSADWDILGSKHDLQDELQKITGIERSVLSTGIFDDICIAKRMSWAATRETTRTEDLAYSLLGIFNVNMPLLYGEGKKSFIRLQEEIMKNSDDHTLFAWSLPSDLRPVDGSIMDSPQTSPSYGLLAESPSDFVTEHDVKPVQDLQSDMPPIVFNNGVRIELPIWEQVPNRFAVISCYVKGHSTEYIGIPILRWGDRYTARCGPLVLISAEDWPSRKIETLLIKAPPNSIRPSPRPNSFSLVRVPNNDDYFMINEVYCLPGVSYADDTRIITFPTTQEGAHAVLFFSPIYSAGNPFPFAVILGSDDDYWVAFIPILREKTADKDFHRLFRNQKGLVQYCMTKNHLKGLLKSNMCVASVLKKKNARLMRFWKNVGVNKEWWEVGLCVKLQVANSNLAEHTVFVCVEIVELKDKYSRDEWNHAIFTPKWWETKRLRWFPESKKKGGGKMSQ